jgi:hypothetical protein
MLGYVEAPDEASALMAAFLAFGVEPADRKRIMVRPTA